ncbi:MAG: ParA family protein [Rhodococcus sp. (in: high G+C Gram-positive bacteria)]|uniref:ParA family protein n=1 Tax=Rhodococcus sp. TaxID=1831 RepID=UPI003BB1F205
MAATILAIANQKGGVGKTTSVINLTRAAVTELGLRVLVVDTDPQGNATKSLAPEYQGSLDQSLATVLDKTKNATIADATVAGEWPGVDVVPAGSDDLADAAQTLVTMKAGRESRLKRALAEVADKYDLILIDCPPSLDQLPINAFTAAHAVVIVTEPGQFALDGLDRLLDTIEIVQEYTNPQLVIAGAIINGYQRTNRMDRWCNDLRESLDAPVLDPPIHRATWIAEATEAGRGLDEWNTPKASNLHRTYVEHLRNILDNVRKAS